MGAMLAPSLWRDNIFKRLKIDHSPINQAIIYRFRIRYDGLFWDSPTAGLVFWVLCVQSLCPRTLPAILHVEPFAKETWCRTRRSTTWCLASQSTNSLHLTWPSRLCWTLSRKIPSWGTMAWATSAWHKLLKRSSTITCNNLGAKR